MRTDLRSMLVLALAALALAVAAPAFAHVTVRADDTSPEGFAKYTVRVPNESDDAATTKIEVQLPDGYEEARYQPLEGWDISVVDGVLVIEGGRLGPGEFQEFSFSARNPAKPGDVVFPAIQTYSDGEEVSWTGGPGSETPASVVTIAGEPGGHAEGGEHGDGEAVDTTAEATEPDESPTAGGAGAVVDTEQTSADGGVDALSIVALLAGLLGVGLGGAALARGRR